MSDSAAQSSQPTGTPAKPASSGRRVSPVVLWMLVLVVALVAFGAVVAMSGGIDGVMQLVGLSSAPTSGATPDGSSTPGKPAGSAAPTSSAAATASAPAAGTLPASAQERVYTEQLLSQDSIKALVTGKLSTIKFGDATVSADTAEVPVKLGFAGGQSLAATMTLQKYGTLWYFFSIRTASSDDEVPAPAEIDSSVVAVFAAQQATASNQKMLVDGVLGGGFKTAKVTGVTKGAGTATVNLLLSGGTAKATTGRLVCISKDNGSTPYWFVVRFDAR